MALKSARSRIRFRDIESVPAAGAARRVGSSNLNPEPPANEEPGMGQTPLPVGEELRRAREGAGLALADVAAHLRIRSNFLGALEEGRPDALPGVTYAIGYVRTYAAFLGLDPETAVRRFKEEAAGLNSKTQLVFPSPAPEGRVPGLAVMLVAAVLAGGAYGGWYWISERDVGMRDLVPMVPERLAQLIEGSAPPVPTPYNTPTREATSAETYAEANPAGSAMSDLRPAPGGTPVNDTPLNDTLATNTVTTDTVTTDTLAADAPSPVAPSPVADGSLAVAEVPTASPVSVAPGPQAPAAGDATDVAELPLAADGSPDVTAPPERLPVADAETTPAAVASITEPTPVERPVADARTVDLPTAPPPASAAPAATAPEAVVPAAPRIAGLIGASEAAVPSERVIGEPTARVVIRASGNSWIEVQDPSGRRLFSGLLSEGDVYRVPNQIGLRLATGNAGALEVSVDGVAVPGLGQLGQVVRNVALDPARLSAGTALGAGR